MVKDGHMVWTFGPTFTPRFSLKTAEFQKIKTNVFWKKNWPLAIQIWENEGSIFSPFLKITKKWLANYDQLFLAGDRVR